MSNTAGEGSTGKLERVRTGFPPVEVDCSGWDPDIPEANWATGKPTNHAMRSRPAIESDWLQGDGSAVWLELVVSFDSRTSPPKVIEQTNHLVGFVCRIDPQLGLTWDFARSRVEADEVVIALAPRGTDAGVRLEQALGRIRSEVARLSPTSPTVTRLGRCA